MQQVTERPVYVVPGQGHAESILELYNAYKALDDGEETATADGETFTDMDEIIEHIQEYPLSVLVSYGWVEPGKLPEDGPEEYEILLGTGGPATRIIGRLGRFNQPDTAKLQGQDWFKPWQATETTSEQDEAILWFAQQFYFGE